MAQLSSPQDSSPGAGEQNQQDDAIKAAALDAFRQAEAFEGLGQYDKALPAAAAVVEQFPGTKGACLAQCIVGNCLAQNGDKVAGVKALMQVEGMMPDPADLVPLAEATKRLKGICDKCIRQDFDIMTPMKPWLQSGQSPWLVAALPRQLDLAKFDVATDILWKRRTAPKARALLNGLVKNPAFDKITLSYYLAYCSYVERDWTAARQAFYALQKSAAGTAYEAPAEYMVGDCYEKMGDPASATTVFMDVIRRFPRHTLAGAAARRLGMPSAKVEISGSAQVAEAAKGGRK